MRLGKYYSQHCLKNGILHNVNPFQRLLDFRGQLGSKKRLGNRLKALLEWSLLNIVKLLNVQEALLGIWRSRKSRHTLFSQLTCSTEGKYDFAGLRCKTSWEGYKSTLQSDAWLLGRWKLSNQLHYSIIKALEGCKGTPIRYIFCPYS